jgi:MFS family permease
LFTLALAPGLPWLVLAMLPLGFGAGAVDAALNGFVARHYEARQMNWLHACWGVGATLGPLLMGEAIAQSHGWRGGYALIGAIQLGLALLFFCTLHGWRGVPPRMTTSSVAAAPACTRRGANSVEGWISPALFLVYTGAEYTIGLWAGTILVLERGVSAGGAALWTAFYFGAIALGRVLVGFFVGRWGNRITVRVGLCLALAGQVAFGFTGSSPWAAVALAAIGLGLAPVYPGLMHEVPRRFAPDAVQTIIGRQSGAGALGVAVLPALAGVFAPQALNAIVALAGGATLVLLAGVLWLDSRTAA